MIKRAFIISMVEVPLDTPLPEPYEIWLGSVRDVKARVQFEKVVMDDGDYDNVRDYLAKRMGEFVEACRKYVHIVA